MQSSSVQPAGEAARLAGFFPPPTRSPNARIATNNTCIQVPIYVLETAGIEHPPHAPIGRAARTISAFDMLSAGTRWAYGHLAEVGWRDDSAPINALRTERDPFETWAEMRGFG